MKYKQTSFLGGLNRQFDPTKIGENEYPLLINGRVRDDKITTINLPQEITTGLPTTINTFQGIYSAGLYLIAFIDGKGYYRSFETGAPENFKLIPAFSLDPTVDRIYMELVPGSSVNFKRFSGTNANDPISLREFVSGSPDCGVVTDGINQDVIVFPDASSRLSQTYEEWVESTDGSKREYVPLGTYPCFSDGILYKAGKDPSTGRLNKLLRSVTGRPLDFMVVVDGNGNKKSSKVEGDANVVAHRVDFNTITSINKIAQVENPQNTTNLSPPILVGTSYNSYLVTPNYNNKIFGEPQFSQRFLFSTSPLNPFCVVDAIGGDTLLIDAKGVISFNNALFAKYEGRNLPFSRKVYPIFNNITQTVACCSKLDNYIYFGVNTIYGPAIVVYDEIAQQWVSIDIYPSLNLVKQFATISTTNTKRLFFITTDNKLYEAFASSTPATCRIYCGEYFEDYNQSVLNFTAVYKNIITSGEASATLYSDGEKLDTVKLPLTQSAEEPITPEVLPFGPGKSDDSDDKTFGFHNPRMSHRFGVWLEWNAKAELITTEFSTKQHGPITNPTQDASIEGVGTTLNNNLKLVFVGWAGLNSSTLDTLSTYIKSLEPDFIILNGNQNQPSGAIGTLQNNVKYYWDELKTQNKVFGVLGGCEILTANGQAHLNYFDGGRYYKKSLDLNTDLFVLNSNINEPDGYTFDSPQAQWLKQQLSNSQKKWKIVSLFGTPSYNNKLQWPFRKWGASLVISAYNRNYERIFSDQFTYVNIGSGTATGFDSFVKPYVNGSKFRNSTDSGLLYVETNSLNLYGSFKNVSDETKDFFQLLG